MSRVPAGLLTLTLIAACAGQPADDPAPAGGSSPDLASAADAPAACAPVDRMPVEGRASAFDSTLIDLGGAQAKLCYGRPSMNGREIFGGLVPYDTLWRTGANEPTTLHIPFAAEIAGIAVEPGSYSIYTVPGRNEWSVIVNRSISQWGIEVAYTPEVRAQEIARAQVPSEELATPVETFVITAEPTGDQSADLVLDWERTRVRIPVRRM